MLMYKKSTFYQLSLLQKFLSVIITLLPLVILIFLFNYGVEFEGSLVKSLIYVLMIFLGILSFMFTYAFFQNINPLLRDPHWATLAIMIFMIIAVITYFYYWN